ncbi:MAG: hypothetical protein K9N23_23470 [Akkermansiaceae bacterium]|nr:hypothetical protein [Akkermansiaceae bacterium]
MKFPIIHRLAYSWSGWPKSETFPPEPEPAFFTPLDTAWTADGLTRISCRWSPERLQLTLRAEPNLSPITIAARVKGRMDHALRKHGWPLGFDRKVAVRSLGENTRETVLQYIATQLDRADLADPRYAAALAEATWTNPDFDLADPLPSHHGRYWYNLHLVAATEDRWRVGREDFLGKIRTSVIQWSQGLPSSPEGPAKPGARSLAVMPDHLHLALRGPIGSSPESLVEEFWRHLNRAAGCRLFSDWIYVGAFSEYPLAAVGGVIDCRPNNSPDLTRPRGQAPRCGRRRRRTSGWGGPGARPARWRGVSESGGGRCLVGS